MTVTIFENYIYIIKTQVFMFRYEHVNSTRKFTIVAEIVSLLKKIYKRDAPFRAGFKVKTLAVLFPPYLREMKQIPRNLNLPPFWCLLFFYGNGTTHSHGALYRRAWLKHAHSFDLCGPLVAILGADQKERGLWEREWDILKSSNNNIYPREVSQNTQCFHSLCCQLLKKPKSDNSQGK